MQSGAGRSCTHSSNPRERRAAALIECPMAPLLLDEELRPTDEFIGVRLSYFAGVRQNGPPCCHLSGHRKAALKALPELRRLGLVPKSL